MRSSWSLAGTRLSAGQRSEKKLVHRFNMRCFHASFGGEDARRISTVCIYGNPRGAAELAGARKRVATITVGHRPHPHDALWPSDWLRNRGRHPARAHSIERLRTLGFLDAGRGWGAWGEWGALGSRMLAETASL